VAVSEQKRRLEELEQIKENNLLNLVKIQQDIRQVPVSQIFYEVKKFFYRHPIFLLTKKG
jgi:hypothetical protein